MTPEQIDAVLARVPAGIPALTGDLTDDEERGVAVRWLLEFYREAELAKPTVSESGFMALAKRILDGIEPIPVTEADIELAHRFDRSNPMGLDRALLAAKNGELKVMGRLVVLQSPDSPLEPPESDETTSEVPGVRGNDSGETTAVPYEWRGFVRHKVDGVMAYQHWDDLTEPQRERYRRDAPWPPPTVAVEVDTWPDGHPPAPGITYYENGFGK